MCSEQRRRKIRSEDANIKRHRCTVGDCISDANGNVGKRVFVQRRHNRVSFRRSNREIDEFTSLTLLVQNNRLVDSTLNFYPSSKYLRAKYQELWTLYVAYLRLIIFTIIL